MIMVLLIAIAGSFVTKAGGRQQWEGFKAGPLCGSRYVNETYCTTTATGPQCTITIALSPVPAWKYTSSCILPIFTEIP